jgi:hypothetical protein
MGHRGLLLGELYLYLYLYCCKDSNPRGDPRRYKGPRGENTTTVDYLSRYFAVPSLPFYQECGAVNTTDNKVEYLTSFGGTTNKL